MAGEANEKCAVTGIVGSNPELAVAELAYETLFAMQHRGPEASGMASRLPDGRLQIRRELGLVRNVYDEDVIRQLDGHMVIGHNRYSTFGSKLDHLQPVDDAQLGFALAHNGNLPVTQRLETHLEKHNIHTKHMSDSEMMAAAIAQYIRNGHDMPDAVQLAYPLFRGAFSSVAMHDGVVVAFRDPKGIRPLAMGTFDGGHAVTSETCGLDIINATYEREVEPGEMIIITERGIESRKLADGVNKLDMFEFVYFARHDSCLYGQRVNEVRRQFGERLAEQHPPITDDIKNIVVIPIPDSSVPATEGYANKLGLRHEHGVIKNRYVGRTFMQTSQRLRSEQLRRKHSIISEVVADRDIIFIDDSIVRMNTMPRIVSQANASGARSVSVLVASPPVRFPDFYGIDTPEQSELAAANMTIEEMREKIDCDYLGFLSLSRMVEVTGLPAEMFNLSCFNGEYPIGIGNHKDTIKTPVSMEFAD